MPEPAPDAQAPAGLGGESPPDVMIRLSIRGALYAGFGLIFVLWVVAGVDMVSRLIEVDERMAAINARFTQAEDLLSTARTETLLGSIYLRDALLDVPENTPYYRDLLNSSRTIVAEVLAEYEPLAGSDSEREAIANLRSEIQKFWSLRLAVLEWEPNRRSNEALAYLRTSGIPKREEILRISTRIQDLHRASFEEQRRELSATYSSLRRRVWLTSGLALLISMAVALFVTMYAGRLERRIEVQRVQDLQKTQDLQRLSAQLVHAQEEERRTIARELHDEVGQALTAVKLEMTAAERQVRSGDNSARAFSGARGILDRALASVRDLSQLLHPSLLDDLGLPEALEVQLRSFTTRTKVAAEFVKEGDDERLAPDLEVCLYRIAQEALNNTAKHARATTCRIRLQRLPAAVLMTVEDNGRGFHASTPAADARPRGLGLLGIRERVANLNGRFSLESAPGQGTRITVELPVVPTPQLANPQAPPHPATAAVEEAQ